MKKTILTKGVACTLVVASVLGATPLYAAPQSIQIDIANINPNNGQIANVLIPERGSSSATIINNRETFKGYKGQGEIYLTLNKVESAKIFVNGTLIDLSKHLDKDITKTIKIDVSPIVRNGDNTLQISDIYPTGATIEVDVPYPTLRKGTPKSVGVDEKVFNMIDAILEAEIKAGGIPGGQLLVAKDGVIIKDTVYGNVKAYDQTGKVKDGVAVTADTLYDLASNTKMYATNYAIQKLVYEGELSIDDKIATVIPGFDEFDKEKTQLTIRHLLTHTGGFIPDPQYHNENYLHPIQVEGKTINLLDKNEDKINDVYTQESNQILEMIKKTPLEYTPGTKNVYSDVDYMLLGLIVEKVAGQSLEAYCQEQLYKPLGLTHTVFNPLQKGFEKEKIAATELFGNTREGHIQFNNIRTEVVQGEVHDEKAFYTMEGISGHAGLFSNAKDLAVLMQVMINGGGYGNVQLFDQKTIDIFTTPSLTNDTYGLGWRRQGNGGYAWSFGEQAPDNTIGHTGWTGTATSIDVRNDLLIVWLSNTKNTPIADTNKNLNRMVGDAFQFDGAGTLSTLIYEGIIGTTDEALAESLLQISLDRSAILREAIETNSNCTKADYKATAALVDVLVTQAELGGKEQRAYKERAEKAYNVLPDCELKVQLRQRLDKLK